MSSKLSKVEEMKDWAFPRGPALHVLFGFWLRWAIFLFVVLVYDFARVLRLVLSLPVFVGSLLPVILAIQFVRLWERAGPPAMPTPVDPAKMPSEYRPWPHGSASLAQSHLF